MKRFIVCCAILSLTVLLLTGCTTGGNASTNKDGIIEPSKATTEPTVSTLPDSEDGLLDDGMEENETTQASEIPEGRMSGRAQIF